MEFKDNGDKQELYEDVVLIESDWNLKDTAKPNKWRLLSVLIESDWNLKRYALTVLSAARLVLIESDWNLKMNADAFIQAIEDAY